MRVLGYYDGYLGFLSDRPELRTAEVDVIDIGTGTGAMAEAWVALHGAPGRMALLDPSPAMLEVAKSSLARRNVEAETHNVRLEEAKLGTFDVLLAAHVIEHFNDPASALRQMRALARPGARLWMSVSKPHWCNMIIWLQWRHRTFRLGDIEQMLARAGFVLETHYRFPAGPPSRTSFGVVARAV